MIADGVIEGSSTTGTADYTLTGAVGAGRTFNQDFANGETIEFVASTPDKTSWEQGLGVLDHGPPRTLTRATVLKSSNSGAKIDWQVGQTYYVFSIASADALGGMMKGNRASTRPWWVRWGWWLKTSTPAAGFDQITFQDGAGDSGDVPVGVVDTGNHTIEFAYMPAGAIMPYAGTTAPAGFLFCQGQAVSRTTYARLFDAIGTTYGVGDGSTTFNVPDLGGRVAAGREASATRLTSGGSGIDGDTLGATGGTETVALVATDLPELLLPAGTGVPGSQTSRGVFGDGTNVGTIPISGTNPGSTGIAHQNTQPTIVLNYMISTGGV